MEEILNKLKRRVEQFDGKSRLIPVVCPALSRGSGHLLVALVTLVAHEDAGHLPAHPVLLQLLQPQLQGPQAGLLCHVVHQHHRVGSSAEEEKNID